MKTAVLIDNNAGIKKDEAKELGIYLVSTPIIIEKCILKKKILRRNSSMKH